MNGRKDVIEVKGLRGLFAFIFCVCCFVTGFAVLPGSIAMLCWNFFAKFFTDAPLMNIWHGIIMWISLFLIYAALFGKNFKGVRIFTNKNITEEDLREAIFKNNSETVSEYEEENEQGVEK